MRSPTTRRARRSSVSPQPHARVRGLHRVADRADELGADGIEVDLVAQLDAERVERARGVVARAIEAAVDRVLDATAQPLEQGETPKRGRRDRELRPAGQRAEQRLED